MSFAGIHVSFFLYTPMLLTFVLQLMLQTPPTLDFSSALPYPFCSSLPTFPLRASVFAAFWAWNIVPWWAPTWWLLREASWPPFSLKLMFVPYLPHLIFLPHSTLLFFSSQHHSVFAFIHLLAIFLLHWMVNSWGKVLCCLHHLGLMNE